jgi:hypothetical protein
MAAMSRLRAGDRKRYEELHDVWKWWADGGVLAGRDDLVELWRMIDEVVSRKIRPGGGSRQLRLQQWRTDLASSVAHPPREVDVLPTRT